MIILPQRNPNCGRSIQDNRSVSNVIYIYMIITLRVLFLHGDNIITENTLLLYIRAQKRMLSADRNNKPLIIINFAYKFYILNGAGVYICFTTM